MAAVSPEEPVSTWNRNEFDGEKEALREEEEQAEAGRPPIPRGGEGEVATAAAEDLTAATGTRIIVGPAGAETTATGPTDTAVAAAETAVTTDTTVIAIKNDSYSNIINTNNNNKVPRRRGISLGRPTRE